MIRSGSGPPAAPSEQGEGEKQRRFIDVTGDSFLSARDALLVINVLIGESPPLIAGDNPSLPGPAGTDSTRDERSSIEGKAVSSRVSVNSTQSISQSNATKTVAIDERTEATDQVFESIGSELDEDLFAVGLKSA